MIGAKYKAYPEYSKLLHSKVGSIPTHWDVWKFKHILVDHLIYGANEAALEDNENDPRYIRITDMNSDGTLKKDTYKSLPLETASDYLLCDKDILLARTGATVGKSFFYSDTLGQCCFAGYLIRARIRINIAEPRYIYWFLQSNLYWEYINNSQIQATLQNVSADKYGEMLIPISNIQKEQTQIANFLDHETAKIDTLIEKQKRLIELLKEKRQAVISHAVTKGLNPDAPMRDSGVEWLGEIPNHWGLKSFKRLFKIRKRIAGTLGYDILSITQRGIKRKDIDSGEGQLSMDYSKYQLVNIGDYAMNHMDLLTGFVDISEFKGVTSPDYRVFTIEECNAIPEFYLYFLQMGYRNKLFFPFGQGAAHLGRWRLPTEAFNEFIAPFPPKSEQKQLVNFIKTQFDFMDKLELKAQNTIQLMKERRVALISAAVTGKIDVSDWKPEN